MTLYALQDVWFGYSATDVIRGIGGSLDRGSFTALVGPNGSGKSTLIRLLAGVLTPRRGAITLWDQPLGATPRRDLARRLAVVPQTVEIPFPFRVRELVRMSLFPRRRSPFLPAEDEAERIAAALAATDLEALADRPFSELSGGERRRTILAGALATQPEILLLDEPTAGLDWGHAVALYEILERENRASELTVLIASHDINLASMWCRDMILLEGGKVVEWGPTDQVARTEQLESVYSVALDRLDGPAGPVHVPRRKDTEQ